MASSSNEELRNGLHFTQSLCDVLVVAVCDGFADLLCQSKQQNKSTVEQSGELLRFLTNVNF